MSSRTRISIVSYLNSKPLLHGLQKSNIASEIELSEDIPARCADKLMTGQADAGLLPVAMLSRVPSGKIFSSYCIGSNGPVNSVLLLSQVHLNEIRSVLLDYQSRTSVQLVRILARDHWQITPEWIEAREGFESDIKGEVAGIIIGDRALEMKGNFPFVYDLSDEWKKMTGLPFVFAVWVTTKELSPDFITQFDEAQNNGIASIHELVDTLSPSLISRDQIHRYLTEDIRYEFGEAQKNALALFQRLLSSL